MNPKHTQLIPISIGVVAIVKVTDKAAEDQAVMLAAISRSLLTSLGRIPYIASIEAIRVVEIEPAMTTRRTQ